MIELLGVTSLLYRDKGFVVKEPAPLPGIVNVAMACVHGDDLYLAGGSNGTSSYSTFRKFNLLTRTWTDLPALPRALEGGVITVIGDNIYIFGGGVMVGGSITTHNANLYKFDINANTWSTLSTSPLGGRRLFAGDKIGNTLYYFGGWNGSQLSRVESFDTATGTWTTLPNLPGIRHGHCCVTEGSKIYIFSGLTSGGGIVNNDVLVFDPATSTTVAAVTTGATKPPVRCYSTVWYEDNNLYIYGGYINGNADGVLNDLWVLNLTTKVWRKLGLYGYSITARGACSAASWKGEFHLLGGWNPSQGRLAEHLYIY